MALTRTHTRYGSWIKRLDDHVNQVRDGLVRVRSVTMNDAGTVRLYVVGEFVLDEVLHDVWILAADTRKGVVLSRGLEMQVRTAQDLRAAVECRGFQCRDGFFVNKNGGDRWE